MRSIFQSPECSTRPCFVSISTAVGSGIEWVTLTNSRLKEPTAKREPTGRFQVGAGFSTDDKFIATATVAQDDLFRFKVDFVRRRVLPLLKSGARIAVSADDEAIVEHAAAKKLSGSG